MTKDHCVQLLHQYAVAHTQSHPANASLPYIGENVEPEQGWWQARQIMYGEEPGAHGCATDGGPMHSLCLQKGAARTHARSCYGTLL